MTPLIPLDDRVMVAGQIQPADLAGIAAAGVTLIVDNRPDGEEPGQPTAAEIEAAARAHGLGFRHIPVVGGFDSGQVAAMAEALAGDGKLLAYCRSGTRSTWLWALARAGQGADVETLSGQAAAA